MTNRMKKNQCLWCADPLVDLEAILCTQCLHRYHARARQINDSVKYARRHKEQIKGSLKIVKPE